MEVIPEKTEPKIQALIHEIKVCTKCVSMENHLQFDLLSHGNSASKSMLISEAPGKASIQNKRYWTGRGGQLMRQVLAELTDKQLEELFYLTDIIKCWPSNRGNNRRPSRVEINNCVPFLEEEISTLKPETIILMGSIAYENSRGILLPPEFLNIRLQTVHNLKIEYNGIIIIPFLHPSNINFRMDVLQYKKQLKDLFTFIRAK